MIPSLRTIPGLSPEAPGFFIRCSRKQLSGRSRNPIGRARVEALGDGRGAADAHLADMRLTSSAFTDGGEIPIRHTCEGADVSPPLSWGEIPEAARSLALVVDDPDAPDPAAPGRVWVHWVVVDLPPDAGGLAENVHRLAHGRVGTNDWSWNRWNGPCPPQGRHRYVFTLYALDRTLELARPSRPELARAMAGHILAETTLVGTYEKRRR